MRRMSIPAGWMRLINMKDKLNPEWVMVKEPTGVWWMTATRKIFRNNIIPIRYQERVKMTWSMIVRNCKKKSFMNPKRVKIKFWQTPCVLSQAGNTAQHILEINLTQ